MKKNFESPKKVDANFVQLSPVSFLRRAADLHGERTALIAGDLHRSWSEMVNRIENIASNLSRLGLEEGDTISLLSANNPELFELHFAIPVSGAVMNTLNTRLEAETIAYILDHADTKLVIVEQTLVPLLSKALELSGKNLAVLVISTAGSDQQVPDEFGDYDSLLAQPDAPMQLKGPVDEWQAIALNYTSGTSGRPKGVVYHHRGAYLMVLGTVAAWQMPNYLRYLSVVPMFHCNGWGHPWVMAMQGGTMIFPKSLAAKDILESINEHDVTHVGAAPIILQMLAEEASTGNNHFDPPVKMLTAGAPPPPSVLEQAGSTGFEVMQVYGLTETYGHISQCLWQDDWDQLATSEQAAHQAMQGIAFPMVEDIKVFDRENNVEVPHDGQTQGEIAIRGNTVMKGYYKDQNATDEAFKDGWFWSGDAAVVQPDGYLQIRDRLKDVIISGGENISSVEVEAVLYRHPSVQAAAIVAQPDPKWGEVPCAFVELRAGEEVDEASIISFCREHLAGFKSPKRVIFQELPKTSTGKIQKFELRKLVRSEDA